MKRSSKSWLMGSAAAALVLAGGVAFGQTTITGAGATFPYPVYAKWADAYAAKTGVHLNYQSIGSGGGIAQTKAKTVDFGASDAPLTQQQLDEIGLIQWPMIMGGVVPVLNVPGVKPGEVKLTPTLLADIYLGKVANWSAPEIAAVNPGVKLPDLAITVVHRADGSGTTWIFTNYLDKVSPEWHSKVGTSTAVSWPTGVGGKGNEGVSAYVLRINGAIGYVEYAYCLQNHMTYTLLRNGAGNFVSPTAKAFQAAAANADWKDAPGYYLVLTDQPGAESWPITGASFILFYKDQPDATKAKAVLSFFAWCYANGQKMAEELDYVPMPRNVADMMEASWTAKVRSAGQAVWK
ncbi:MAG: phosphate ABC transporter substrate-binding protein PstS [Acidobacteria bacterium 21-70-11]|nr:MAG: phosphate ABC transporter substrate-binding protein PstS [Acidobacteria bacterium 21-70-11]HQU33759.1 phosphate ABC transporter substrate-binding protein PstS [Thermoanaerobaculaceae bacterium]